MKAGWCEIKIESTCWTYFNCWSSTLNTIIGLYKDITDVFSRPFHIKKIDVLLSNRAKSREVVRFVLHWLNNKRKFRVQVR